MKRLIQKHANILLILLVFFAFTLTFACLSYAGIANTVHNMSTSAPPTATIKAQVTQPAPIPAGAETEICVFCHIPHNARPGTPLWNRGMPGSAYTMYKSDYLYRIGYSPTVYDPTTAQPGLISKQCLSCHDGTVAIGAIYMVRGTILGANLIAMSGVTADKMPTTAVGFIGGPAGELGNLTTHHTVGIKYDSTVSVAFGSGTRGIELTASPNTNRSLNLPIVYTLGATKYVECVSCHDPHLQDPNIANDDGKKGKFLRVTGSTLAGKISTTCTHCHTKTGWTGSAHQSLSYTYIDANVNTTFGTGAMTGLVCMNCHKTHKGLGAPYLLRQQWSRTCFQGAGANNNECHATALGGKTNSISNIFGKTYKHPIVSDGFSPSNHTNLDVKYGTGVTRVPTGSKGITWSDSRHAECVDCHNPHKATNTPARVGTAAWYPTTVDNTSNQTAKSGALTGVTGVQPTWPAIWTVPTTFTTQESSTYEYQICFKCHSYWALSDGDGITTYTTASGATVTDQAMEFNPNNKSAHPVVVTLNNQTGSTGTKPLAAAQMSAPWTAVGNQTMYCSDCHGTDNEASGDPKGPHGSSFKYMLKGTGKYWPTNASGVLYTLGNKPTNNSHLAGLFCMNCHPVQSATGVSYNNVHNEHDGSQIANVACIRCHILVPHGGKMSRFIGDNNGTMPTRYAYLSTITNMYIQGFTKAATPTGYARGNCRSGSTGCSPHSFYSPSENW